MQTCMPSRRLGLASAVGGTPLTAASRVERPIPPISSLTNAMDPSLLKLEAGRAGEVAVAALMEHTAHDPALQSAIQAADADGSERDWRGSGLCPPGRRCWLCAPWCKAIFAQRSAPPTPAPQMAPCRWPSWCRRVRGGGLSQAPPVRRRTRTVGSTGAPTMCRPLHPTLPPTPRCRPATPLPAGVHAGAQGQGGPQAHAAPVGGAGRRDAASAGGQRRPHLGRCVADWLGRREGAVAAATRLQAAPLLHSRDATAAGPMFQPCATNARPCACAAHPRRRHPQWLP